MASFVLVPGALHCAGHFDGVASLLSTAGSEVHVVDLPALGEDLSASFESHVAAVVAAVDGATLPVVLFGHSTAGRAITAAAEQRNASVRLLIFLAAETLPGPWSLTLDPVADWLSEGLLVVDGGRMAVADRKGERLGEVLYSGATAIEREAAVALLRASPVYAESACERLALDGYWRIPRAYVKCTLDLAMPPVHQDVMYARLGEGALRFELDSDHCPFISCPGKLAELMLKISALPASAFVLRQLCEAAWQDQGGGDINIELLDRREDGETAPVHAAGPPPPKRPHVPREDSGASRALAYRISKSRRDSTLVKVLKFPCGVAVGAPVAYWYESYVDDPAQYTNSSLNVPERGHEAPLDVAGVSRSLCAEGTVTSAECSRISSSWLRIVTKVPGEAWTAAHMSQVWGVDGREWNGSYVREDGTFGEQLSKYTKGSAEAFWEDVPKKALALLATMADRAGDAAL